MNRLIRFGALAGYIGAGVSVCNSAHADIQSGVNTPDSRDSTEASTMVADASYASASGSSSMSATKRDPGFQAGPVKVTLGGFIEAAAIWRSRNETADVGSSYNSIPYASSNNYYTSEFRESARQSRLSLLAQGPEDGVNKVEAFYAMDFLGVGVTSNSNESNSYTPRIREAYADWTRTDYGFQVLGGQTWSMATLYKHELDPRKENIPLTIDGQYVAGFQWARQAQIRFVKSFGDDFALGLSLEEPQDVIKPNGTAPGGSDGSNSGGSLLNSTTTYSTDIAPDVVVKFAADPGWGHYEVYSLSRFMHDRSEYTPGDVTTTTNHTSVAQSFGGGMILPVVSKALDFQASGIVGHGNGRYGSGQLADSTYSTINGAAAPFLEQQFLVGLIGHPTKTLDTYLYAGMEHEKQQYGYGTLSSSGSAYDNETCALNPASGASLSCSGITGTVRQVTGGFWWKFYQGSLGYLTTGLQGGVVKNATLPDVNGYVGKTSDSIVMASFRYYPFQ